MRPVRCPRCWSDWVRPGFRRGRFERLLGAAKLNPYRCQACAHRFHRFAQRNGVTGTSVPQPDRREFERLPADLPVFFWNTDLHAEGMLRDISAGGCWIDGTAPVQDGASLELCIHRPDGSAVTTAGVVARLTPGQGFAVKFFTSGVDHRLRSLVETCHAEAYSPSQSFVTA
jgi:PilZ domain